MGFMLAALAILASITNEPLLLKMNKQGHYRDLLTHLFVASIIYFFIFLSFKDIYLYTFKSTFQTLPSV